MFQVDESSQQQVSGREASGRGEKQKELWNRDGVLNNSLFPKWLKCELYANIWGGAENSSNVGPISTGL